jgi:hypothetical protein
VAAVSEADGLSPAVLSPLALCNTAPAYVLRMLRGAQLFIDAHDAVMGGVYVSHLLSSYNILLQL